MASIYEEVTNSLIECLEKGVTPWRPSYDRNKATSFQRYKNPFTGTKYSGINFIILSAETYRKGFKDINWATEKQILKAGGVIQKFQKPTKIVHYRRVQLENKKIVHFAKSYEVYNLEQTKGVKVRRVQVKTNEVYEKVDIYVKNKDL